MRTYIGSRTIDGIRVLVDGKPLNERYDIKTFTRNGFEWTYEGAEPAQLALALLADHLGDDRRALELTGFFMREVVANFENDWEMTSSEIDETLAKLSGRNAQ